MSNTVGVHHQEAETLSNYMKMIDFSLWESRSKAVNAFIRYYSFDITDFVFISLLGFLLVISALLGHGFYIWHFKTSNEHTQSRLLNILNKVHSQHDLCGLVVSQSRCVIFNCLCVSGTLCGIESVSGLVFPVRYQEAELGSVVLERNARLVSCVSVSVSVCQCDV